METIAQKELRSQEELKELEEREIEQCLTAINREEFWEEIGRQIRQGIRITLEKAISYEFREFIGALEYERSAKRNDVESGYRSRDFGTVYGVIEGIKIPAQGTALL